MINREILFRGKRIDNGKMVEGSYCPKKTGHYEGVKFVEEMQHLIIVDMNGGGYQYAEVDSETVCQYTGLTDKNGRKIFEGDIVKYHFGEDVAPIKFGSYQSCFDSQHTEHCGFYVDWKTKRNFRKDLGYWVHMVDAEIVGNIFDNPELLEVENEQ